MQAIEVHNLVKEYKNGVRAIDGLNLSVKSFGLEKYIKYPTASYSGGIKRRLDIAMNMMSLPKILFLDEPTVGMDIESRIEMWKTIKKIKNECGTTIFLTTHYLEEADKLCNNICIMKNGKELVCGTPESLRKFTNQNLLKIGFDSTKKAEACADVLSEKYNLKLFKFNRYRL